MHTIPLIKFKQANFNTIYTVSMKKKKCKFKYSKIMLFNLFCIGWCDNIFIHNINLLYKQFLVGQ